MKQRVKTFLKGLGGLLAALALWLFYLVLVGENPTGWGAFGVFMMTLYGIVMIGSSCLPTKYEWRQCANCGTVTEQFQTKRESKQLKYMCEKCGREIVVPLCKTCRKAMELVDKESEQWYCAKDGLLLYARENRTVENIKLDLKESAPEQVVEAPTTSEPASSSKKTKFCRECGASIPRDSKYCEECGASLV